MKRVADFATHVLQLPVPFKHRFSAPAQGAARQEARLGLMQEKHASERQRERQGRRKQEGEDRRDRGNTNRKEGGGQKIGIYDP